MVIAVSVAGAGIGVGVVDGVATVVGTGVAVGDGAAVGVDDVPPRVLAPVDPHAARISRLKAPIIIAGFRCIDQCSAVIAAYPYRFLSRSQKPIRALVTHAALSPARLRP
jgi:hypothetical protein